MTAGAERIQCGDGDLLAELRPKVMDVLRAHEQLHPRSHRFGPWLDVGMAATWFFASYAILLFVPLPGWGLALAIVSMGLAMTASLTNVVHTLMHHSVVRSPRASIVAAQVLAPLGASWRWWVVKHSLGHHAHTGVAGLDPDSAQAPLLRFDRSDAWRPWHRAQHLYAWFLYPLLTLRYLFFSDVPFIVTGREKGRVVEHPSPGRTAVLLLDKVAPPALLLTPAFLMFPPLDVLAVGVAAFMVNGLSTVLVFAPGHWGSDRPMAVPDADGRLPTDFAATVIQGTLDTQVHNPIGRWFMSGLDYHIEHHLFPWVAHRHLHLIAPVVEEVATAHGVVHTTLPSYPRSVVGHARRLRDLGQRPDHEARAHVAVEGADRIWAGRAS